MPSDDLNRRNGLSPKEKSYLICSCQTRSSRYLRLKNLAADAMKHNKIFLIHGYCTPIRKALVERGWVEKVPPNKMDLAKLRNKRYRDNSEMHIELEKLLLSNFVEKCDPNFVWNAKDDRDDYATRSHNVVYNKLKVEALWTTKQGLCTSIKSNCWYYIEDVAEINSPRTYSSFDEGEKEDFERDYKLTACTSLLKWVLSMVANDRPIFVETGTIAINVIVFALNRCKEYLFRKQNKDIDRYCVSAATPGQWKSFLKKYYLLMAKQDIFTIDKDNKLPLYLGYAKFLLKEIHKYRPQLSCEGCHNIWIIKPAHCSRGRGIRMASKLGVLTDLLNRGKYVFQKYIEEPLLIHETKFDIRQYYLITNTCPLVIWMYKDCYLKFSSQKYSLESYHESIHLTNNAVQKKYKNCANRHPELPQNNMWDLETYKEYLVKTGKETVWDEVIYPGMRKSIVGIMLNCQESISYSKNRFELYGCDFILDKDYKPWLIEINSCPDLNPTTEVTAKICPAVLTDIIKVVIDYSGNYKASTGQFECIYRQTVCMPQYGQATDLTVRGHALPMDYFYRGKLPQEDTNLDAKLEKTQDMKSILNKLRMAYETDIMVEPDDSTEELKGPTSIKLVKDNMQRNTKSDEDLNAVAGVITGQLDDLLDRITTENTSSVKMAPSFVSFPSSNNMIKKRYTGEVVRSVTAINSPAKKSCRFASAETINIKTPFNFSKLDDGPNGKGSGSICDANQENKLTQKLNDVHQTQEKQADMFTTFHVTDAESIGLIDATKRLFSFLDEKEREYNRDLSHA
ncbi:tubulin glycylase 3A-like [Pectinophora gossypiella]|uniref:tubulin glycylase 3A-like n=1 Tax=Pectinophora gossypiella TaxID=13191 RepID=UPI00214ED14C|nr:tubulin glycylase 3A-like [Pectinophora gossypiella]